MTRLQVKDALIEEESTVTIKRSSPRRRKRDPDEGIDGLEIPSPASKRIKQQIKAATKPEEQTLKQKAVLIETQSTVKLDKKRRSHIKSKAVTSEVEQTETPDTEAVPGEKILNGVSKGTPNRKRKEKVTQRKGPKGDKEKLDIEEDPEVSDGDTLRRRKRQAKEVPKKIKKVVEQDTDTKDENKEIDGDTPKKVKRKRKTKEEKEAEAMPLASRTIGLRMFVGAHVSIAKGVQNSVTNCHHIGGNAFALFLKSQRKWDNPALSDENRDAFHSHCHTHKYDASSHVLPHGSYLVNLAQEDPTKVKQAYDAFLDDLHRCEALGIRLYNFHPGASGSSPLPTAITRLANNLNIALSATSTVTPLLENMAGSGTVIGSRFSDLASIIRQIKPEFQSRIGVCLDTCHAFAAGYDLRTPASFKAVLQEFDDVVGIKYLKALHLNDSKAPLGSKRDLHQNIGLGFLGLRAFHNVMNESRFEGLPLILETPCEKPDPQDPTGIKMVEDKGAWAREIKLLESLIGMDVESEEFRKLERELSEMGRAAREKMLKSVEEKERKERRKVEKGQRTLVDMMKGEGKKKGGKRRKRGDSSSSEGSNGEDEGEDADID